MDRRKELREQYKSRKVVGGIFRICNKENGRFWLQSTDDMHATHNMLGFNRNTDNCSIPALQKDWKLYGKDAFELEELELLEKKQEQTSREFQQDLEVLLEFWSEKLPAEPRY